MAMSCKSQAYRWLRATSKAAPGPVQIEAAAHSDALVLLTQPAKMLLDALPLLGPDRLPAVADPDDPG